jgi:Uncharacterized protein conserved in bacteria (DUF2252)
VASVGAQKDDAAGDEPVVDVPMSASDDRPWTSSVLLSGDDRVMFCDDDRRTHGTNARRDAPRSSHAAVTTRGKRRDPVDLIRERGVNRDPKLLATQHTRMLVSPFAYFRGSLLSMASDLSETPRTGLTAQICGDASISNFGVFRTLSDGNVFDVADFTETASGPWEWDLKRLAASIEISGRDSDFSRDDRRTMVLGAARSYREAMRRFAAIPSLEVWSARLDTDALLTRLRSLLSADRTPSGWHVVKKANAAESHPGPEALTRFVDAWPKIAGDHPSLVPIEDMGAKDRSRETDRLERIVRSYTQTLQPQTRFLLGEYSISDAARKAFGVSGAGTDSWLVLLIDGPNGIPIHLELKRVGASTTERFWWKSDFPSHGHRAVHGQKLVQASEDTFLGWGSDPSGDRARDYYVRRLPDWAESSEAAGMTPASTELWGRACGWALARAHARSGDRIAIAAYLGRSDSFDQAIAKFSRHYADQNERDYEAFRRAVRRGRLVAHSQP